MNWDRMKTQLELILDAPMSFVSLTSAEWSKMAGAGAAEQGISCDDMLFFYLGKEHNTVKAMAVPEALVTRSERKLVELLLETYRGQDKRSAFSGSEEERKAHAIREWLEQQMDIGLMNADMPESLSSPLSLYHSRVPLLLSGNYSDSKRIVYGELKKVLESFFEADMLLIPLKEKEWLILGSEDMISQMRSEERDREEEETLEESLSALAEGLYEMLMTEGIGECHIAISYPIIPSKSLLATVYLLRESIAIGRTFHVAQNIHLPWQIHLERLLQGIGESERTKFLEHVLRGVDHVLDAETLTTLEQFFELDCNVSETAKRLYIHRNTLLYRLDKFKQETGLDVRRFHHAVLVKTALLLYKITKR
jgi:sugar diacid utilization regulator